MYRFTILLLTLALARAEPIVFPAPAATPELAFPLAHGKLGTLASGGTGTEILPLLGSPIRPVADPAKPGAGFRGESLGELRFEWLDTAGPVSDYHRRLDPATGIATTTFQRGGAGFTVTTFVSRSDDLLVLHLRADKPGFLSFRIRLTRGETRATLEDRRGLVLPSARAWVLPMEAEVEPGDGGITVRGEGEALVLAAAANPGPGSDRLAPLGFSRSGLPDLCAVWQGLLGRQLAARPPAPAE